MKLSICIPSYNRTNSLINLLHSIDGPEHDIQIVIAEDNSPSRIEIRNLVEQFKKSSSYSLVYHENEKNMGYDANLRTLVNIATGEYLLFMGDDDLFKPGALKLFIEFLYRNSQYNYVLRSYETIHNNGVVETFHYFPKETILKAGGQSAVFLYKRSVAIAGFTIKREAALKYAVDQFDGTLLYQLVWILPISFYEDTIYCHIPVAIGTQSFRNNNTDFGSSENEKRFTRGKISAENSIRFTLGFFEISSWFDRNHNSNLTPLIRKDLSKYAYPILSIQRKNGFLAFFSYIIQLAKRTHINQTWHYYFYAISLLLLGEKICDNSIVLIKRMLGYTPRF
jgi:abequosyltransferase